jgi:streptogramin lyase
VTTSAGDCGYDNELSPCYDDAPQWPAVSPNVISVGGTELERVEKPKEGERGWKEIVWPDSGSGCSLYESEPIWQEAKTVPKACVADRIDNDVASVAEEVSVYSTPRFGGWHNAGGTSASSPLIAGVEAHADSATKKLGADAFYKKPSMLFHVSEGGNGECGTESESKWYLCHATKEGYNGPTGMGTPDGVFNLLPTVVTVSVTGVTETGAMLNGTVDPNGLETKYYFEYGTTESYGSKTAEASAGSGSSNVEEGKTITGLTPSTTYYFRMVATNSSGTTYGLDQVFSTTGKPTVETGAATSVGETGATLNGVVNSRGAETKYYFQYGTTVSYGKDTSEVSAGWGMGGVKVSQTITSLASGTTYHFRLVASNGDGTTYGSDQTVTPGWKNFGFSLAFGSKGTGNGMFEGPAGVAVDGEGHVWVTDGNNERLQEFSAAGEYVRQVKTEGRPLGVAVDKAGDVWVTDENTDRVQEFNATGGLVRAFGSEGYGDGQFRVPAGIAIDKEGDVWVTDVNGDRVQEFSSEGVCIRQFGTDGTGNGQFQSPWGIAIDPKGDLWVTDSDNNRVQEFSPEGTFIREVGSYGTGNGQFEVPRGISVDSEGHVLVSDFAGDRVQEFTSSGEYIRQFGSKGSGAGQFNEAFLMTFDSKGNLWIADRENGRVQKWGS